MKGSKWNCSEATCQKCIADDSGPSLNSLIASCNGAEGRSQLIRVVGLLRDKEQPPNHFNIFCWQGSKFQTLKVVAGYYCIQMLNWAWPCSYPTHKVKTGSYLCRYWCQYLTFVGSTHQVLTQAIRAAFWHTPHPPVLHWQEGGVRVGKDHTILYSVHLSSKWWQWEGRRLIVSINSCSCRLLPVNLSAR